MTFLVSGVVKAPKILMPEDAFPTLRVIDDMLA